MHGTIFFLTNGFTNGPVISRNACTIKVSLGKKIEKTKPFLRYYFTIFFNFKIYIQVVKLRKQIVLFLYKKKNKSKKHVLFFFCARQTTITLLRNAF